MTQVLAQADIPVDNTRMEFICGPDVANTLRVKLQAYDQNDLSAPSKRRGFVVISPFTRWASKNWPLDRFIQIASILSKNHVVLMTGTKTDQKAITACQLALNAPTSIINLAGQLSLAELAELMSQAELVISGDSFPMHLATAVFAPLVTLFGPTDERKTGPRSDNSIVLRPAECNRCDKPGCARTCLTQIPVSQLESAAKQMLKIGRRPC